MIKSILAAGAAATMAVTPAMAGQFNDVEPTNWAYGAIETLQARYGCAVGYPNGSFKPGRAASRAEVAALVAHCLDNITSYADAKDAALAAALRAEFQKEIADLDTRVTDLEVAQEKKARGVGNYVGLGVLLNRQGVSTDEYSEDRTISGITVQGRYAVTNRFSVRPYLNGVADPSSSIGAAGGALVTYDQSIASRVLSDGSKVSAANLYGGVGYQVPFVNNTDSNYQAAVGDRGQVVLVAGVEGRVTDSLVGFLDLKFPTTKTEGTTAAYSPVLTTGLGFKF